MLWLVSEDATVEPRASRGRVRWDEFLMWKRAACFPAESLNTDEMWSIMWQKPFPICWTYKLLNLNNFAVVRLFHITKCGYWQHNVVTLWSWTLLLCVWGHRSWYSRSLKLATGSLSSLGMCSHEFRLFSQTFPTSPARRELLSEEKKRVTEQFLRSHWTIYASKTSILCVLL